MPLDTRSKNREPSSAMVEFSIDNSFDQAVKLSLPRDSIKFGAGEVIRSSLFDISSGGCAIASPAIIPPGIMLNIRIDSGPFNMPGEPEIKDPMEFSGKVRSCIMRSAGQYRIGVQFYNPKKEYIDRINKFINAKDRRKGRRWDMTEE
jgi:c-di-GMP-binding flagellar brake protein YcgR